jgi:hypothetical protein
MQQMAYYQQQQAQQKPPSQQDWQPQSNDEFARVEGEVGKLRQKLAAGKIDQAAFEKALKKLMVADAQGRWWMLGTETLTWYRYDGASWVVDTPPGRSQSRAVNLAPPRTSTPSRSQAASGPGFGFWFKSLLVSTLMTTIGFILADLIGGFKLLGPNALSRIVPGILIGLLFGIGQLMLIGSYIQGGGWILLGCLAAGALIGDSSIYSMSGLIMGLGGALPGFFVLKRGYQKAGLFLILQPLILMAAWSLASAAAFVYESRPWGPDPMMDVVQFNLIKGLVAGLIVGAGMGIVLLIILRRPKEA